MARILLVLEDVLTAQHLVRGLRQAGHTPLLARDGEAAVREAGAADLVVLDLCLPDHSGEAVLANLKHQPLTARLPVLLLAGKARAAAFLRSGNQERVAGFLIKPVAVAELLGAVSLALATGTEWEAAALAEARRRQSELIWRLIIEGPDPFVQQLCGRLSADREANPWTPSPGALAWPELAQWARREGLVDEEQACLLARVPQSRTALATKGHA